MIQVELKSHSRKKNLRDIILSNRENMMFKDANNLRQVYLDYMQFKKEQ